MNDILAKKRQSIARCIRQARAYYALPSDKPFLEDYLRQDAIVANLMRACEQCIDMANHAIRTRDLGLPADSAESFRLLAREKVIDTELADKLVKMVGFRNRAVHEYEKIDYRIVESAVTDDSDDLLAFAARLVAAHSDE